MDPVEELQDASEAPKESFEPPRRSTCTARPPEKSDVSTKGQTHGSLRSHSFAMAAEHCLAQTSKDKNTHTVERGVRMCGDRGMESAMKEMKQMHCRQTFAPVLPSDLDPEEKRKVLNSTSFMKEKNNEEKTLKTGNVAGGRKQQEDEVKGKNASPTIKTESAFITLTMDAKEERDVATADFLNFFVQTPMPENEIVHMKLTKKLCEIMCMIAPEVHSPFVMLENGKKVLHVKLLKALHGILKAAPLAYQ